jgi:hypothetical protein
MSTGYHIYFGTGGTPNYASPVATVLFAAATANTFATNLPGLTDGTTYTIGVRAYIATAEEANTNTVTVTADAVNITVISARSAVVNYLGVVE